MTDDQIHRVREMLAYYDQPDRTDEIGATMNAGADALRALLALTERRCGNCGRWDENPDKPGAGMCYYHDENRVKHDGCILGWVAKS